MSSSEPEVPQDEPGARLAFGSDDARKEPDETGDEKKETDKPAGGRSSRSHDDR